MCMEAMRDDGDDAITCANGHRTCLRCAGRMVKPCADCKPACTGLLFTCPLCSRRATLKPGFVLAILQGSWARFYKLHKSDAHLRDWFAKCEAVAHA